MDANNNTECVVIPLKNIANDLSWTPVNYDEKYEDYSHFADGYFSLNVKREGNSIHPFSCGLGSLCFFTNPYV